MVWETLFVVPIALIQQAYVGSNPIMFALEHVAQW